jgi:hypothetical protein
VANFFRVGIVKDKQFTRGRSWIEYIIAYYVFSFSLHLTKLQICKHLAETWHIFSSVFGWHVTLWNFASTSWVGFTKDKKTVQVMVYRVL